MRRPGILSKASAVTQEKMLEVPNNFELDIAAKTGTPDSCSSIRSCPSYMADSRMAEIIKDFLLPQRPMILTGWLNCPSMIHCTMALSERCKFFLGRTTGQ